MPKKPKPSTSHRLFIQELTVSGLFGRYNYKLGPIAGDSAASPLFILYGDNGSGKTTILKMLFHLLSPHQSRRHRWSLSQIAFHMFEVKLSGGIVIGANRSDPFARSYTLTYRDDEKKQSVSASLDFDGSPDQDQTPEVVDSLERIYKHLEERHLTVYWLDDARQLQSDELTDVESPATTKAIWEALTVRSRARLAAPPTPTPGLSLRESIQSLERWMQEEALVGSGLGDTNVQTVYEDIITKVAGSPQSSAPVSQDDLHSLADKLQAIQQETVEFAKLGLGAPPPTDRLLKLLRTVPSQNYELTWNIARPYADSLQARLEALRSMKEVLNEVESTINGFLVDKSIRLHVRNGLLISTNDGVTLSPDALSSGERQLLLLLANAVTSRRHATIFIIDEPEISLNVKWQRQLIQALLRVTRGSDVQFVLATHCIELLAQHRSAVAQLRSAQQGVP